MSEPVALCFSGGKDCSLALHEIESSDAFDVSVLLTTVTRDYDRISMHGVRRSLLEAQARAIGRRLIQVEISPAASNVEYEAAMDVELAKLPDQGIRRVVFGDIFLEDLRVYRERQMAAHGLECLFPLWKRDTDELARTFLDAGFRATTACIDPKKLDRTFVGCEYTEEFLARLSPGIDPCGENGEFHTFVTDGPIFDRPIAVQTGDVVERDGFVFCDILDPSADIPR